MSAEHLFKLKKDGKTVGYERFVYCDQREGYLKGKSLVPQHSKDGVHWGYIYLWELKTSTKGYWFEAQLDNDTYIEHDEKYPFVTKDKNGKDVFAGDRIKAGNWYFEVIWQKYGYGLKGEKSGFWRQFHEFEDIELIKEKEDDTNKT